MSIQLRYGIIGGILCSSSYLYIFNDAIGKTAGTSSPYYIFLVYGCLLVSLIFAYQRIKKDVAVLDFKTALKTGIAVAFIAALCVSIAMFIDLTWIKAEWFAKQKIKNPEYSEWKASFMILNQIFFPGAMMSLLLSLIFKTRGNR